MGALVYIYFYWYWGLGFRVGLQKTLYKLGQYIIIIFITCILFGCFDTLYCIAAKWVLFIATLYKNVFLFVLKYLTFFLCKGGKHLTWAHILFF